MSSLAPEPMASLEARAQQLVAAVRDEPEGRYRLRAEFYQRYGGAEPGGFGYGNSEMAFLRWEINRGVLNRIDDPKRRGSPWWRSVNEALIFTSQLAGLIHESGAEAGDMRPAVRFWLEYLRKPGGQAWYRAHNASIVEAYILHADLAMQEDPSERAFVNVVLSRVLYAESLVEGVGFGLGGWSKLLSMPALPAVRIMVQLPQLYPTEYPLPAKVGRRLRKLVSRRVIEAAMRDFGELPELPDPVGDVAEELSWIKVLPNAMVFLLYYFITTKIKDLVFVGRLLEDWVEFLLDRVLIAPHLGLIYRTAAKEWLQAPTLPRLLHRGVPAYPRRLLRGERGGRS